MNLKKYKDNTKYHSCNRGGKDEKVIKTKLEYNKLGIARSTNTSKRDTMSPTVSIGDNLRMNCDTIHGVKNPFYLS